MIYRDMVEETATYASEVFTLTGALNGRNAFGYEVGTGSEVYYRAVNADGTQFEVGIASYDGSALTRLFALTRSSGFSGEFSGTVAIALVIPARAVPVINRQQSAQASGVNSIACVGGDAQGENAVAIGLQALTQHEGGVAVGVRSETFSTYQEAFGWSFRWSGQNETSGLETLPLEGARGWGDPLQIPAYSTIVVRALVVGSRDSDAAAYAAEITACVRRVASGNAEIVGTPTVTEVGKTSGVTVSATITVAAPDKVQVACAGVAGQYWNWSGVMIGAIRM